MADALTQSRRDYGAAPAGVPVTKTQERRLREQQACAGPQQDHAESGTLNPTPQTLGTSLELRERQREAACWSSDDFDDSQESQIEARAAIHLRKPSGSAAQVVHRSALISAGQAVCRVIRVLSGLFFRVLGAGLRADTAMQVVLSGFCQGYVFRGLEKRAQSGHCDAGGLPGRRSRQAAA